MVVIACLGIWLVRSATHQRNVFYTRPNEEMDLLTVLDDVRRVWSCEYVSADKK